MSVCARVSVNTDLSKVVLVVIRPMPTLRIIDYRDDGILNDPRYIDIV